MVKLHKTEREQIGALKKKLGELSPQALEAFDLHLHELIEKAWAREHARLVAEETAKRKRGPKVAYRQQYIRCGREGCRCSQGQPHGPYWYAYYRSPRTGRVVSKYLGKLKRTLRPS